MQGIAEIWIRRENIACKLLPSAAQCRLNVRCLHVGTSARSRHKTVLLEPKSDKERIKLGLPPREPWFEIKPFDEKRKNFILSLTEILKSQPHQKIEVAALGQLRAELDVVRNGKTKKIATYVRRYPLAFCLHSYYTPNNKRKTWCSFTPEAQKLLDQERQILHESEPQLVQKLRKLLMISVKNRLPLDVVDLVRGSLGLPFDFRESVVSKYPNFFFVKERKERLYLELAAWDEMLAVSALERSAQAPNEGKKKKKKARMCDVGDASVSPEEETQLMRIQKQERVEGELFNMDGCDKVVTTIGEGGCEQDTPLGKGMNECEGFTRSKIRSTLGCPQEASTQDKIHEPTERISHCLSTLISFDNGNKVQSSADIEMPSAHGETANEETSNNNAGAASADHQYSTNESSKFDKPQGDLQLHGSDGSDGDMNLVHLRFPWKNKRGLQPKKAHQDEIEEFQSEPYISPYKNDRHLEFLSNTVAAEKYAVAMIHEFLSLTLEKRSTIEQLELFRRPYRLPDQLLDFLLKYDGIFYVVRGENQSHVFLKEAYKESLLVEKEPLVVWQERFVEFALSSSVGKPEKGMEKKKPILRGYYYKGSGEYFGKKGYKIPTVK